MTDNTKFPYTAWRLMPSFKPVAVEIVGFYSGPRTWKRRELEDSKGKTFHPKDLFDSKHEAIEWARGQLNLKQKSADKVQANIDKKRAEIAKAESA